MGAISCIYPTLWRFGFLATKNTLPKEISWLKCSTSHAYYLRRVLIHWLMAKNVNLQLLGISSSPDSAYSENHSFGQQCFNDDLLTTTDPKCAKCLPESLKSQPKKPHISEAGKPVNQRNVNHSRHIQLLMTAKAIHHRTVNPSRHLQVLTTSKATHQRMANPSLHLQVLTTSKASHQRTAYLSWHLQVLTTSKASHQRMVDPSRHLQVLTTSKATHQRTADYSWHLQVLTRAKAIIKERQTRPGISRS